MSSVGASGEIVKKTQPRLLPPLELAVYAVCFAVSVGTAGFSFFMHITYSSILELDSTSFRDGFFGYKMDNTFMELKQFLACFVPMLLILAAHLMISQVTLRFCSLEVHHLCCASVTICLSCGLLSVKCTAMLLTLHLCCLLASCAASPMVVWSVVLVAFLRFSGASFGSHELRVRLGLAERGVHLFYPISGYLYCRFLSMGLCLAVKATSSGTIRQHLARNLPASLHYAFYLPNFLGGPVVTLDDFLAQRQQRDRPQNLLTDSLQRACRLVLWLMVTLAIVHWLPIGAYLETLGLRLASRREPIAFGHLAFAMYTRGQLFMLEYVQYYGWPALFASLDGIRLPSWPACICRVVSYREMWRLFDRGLFSIVKEHVYIPLGGSRRGLGRQLGATAACFAFICLYHGNYDSVQTWILLNLALVAAELLVVQAYRSGVETALLRCISPGCLRRLTGCAAALNLIPPSIGIFYFFYGTHAGNLIMREILWKPLIGQSSIVKLGVFVATFYCSVQLAIEYKLRGAAN